MKFFTTVIILQIYYYLNIFLTIYCSGELHSPLFRIIPPLNIYPEESELSVKGFNPEEKTVDNRIITLFETDLNGVSNYGYYMQVGIGTPPQKFNLVIDTGSSNTAIAGFPQKYLSNYFKSEQSSTYIDHNLPVGVPYDSGSWKGVLSSDIFTFDGIAYIDVNKTLKYGKAINVRSNFGLIKESTTFFPRNGNFQGILGLAYPILEQPSNLIHKSTLFDDVVMKYGLPNMFSVLLCGHNRSNSEPKTNGFFIAGGQNDSLYNPPLIDILIHRKWFYEVIISRISVSGKPIILTSCKEYNRDKTILDTGTADSYFPGRIFHSLISSIIFNMRSTPFFVGKNSPFWQRRAVICILSTSTNHPASYFPEIHFEFAINDTSSLVVSLSAQQYIQYVGDQTDSFGNRRNCFKFGFGIAKSGTILGDSFLEGFYLLFNKELSKVSIAQSKCNLHVSNLPRSRIIKVNRGQSGLLACAVSNTVTKSFISQLTPTLTIIIGILFGLILIPSLSIMIYYRCNESQSQEKISLIK